MKHKLYRLGRWLLRHIEWVIYYRLTIWERMAYDQGVLKGMHCVHVKVVGPQMTQIVQYFPGREPVRQFATYREFMDDV
jgi:hypothetical protein